MDRDWSVRLERDCSMQKNLYPFVLRLKVARWGLDANVRRNTPGVRDAEV